MSTESREDVHMFMEASKAVNELYSIRDNFPKDSDEKAAQLQGQSNVALQLLDKIPQEDMKLPRQRAIYQYLRGKVFDVFSEYRKEAEDHLSEAVKLNPSWDAWLTLGYCLWKKGDLAVAKNCLMNSSSLRPNKDILCRLSTLERIMAEAADAEDGVKIADESIKHAKEAVAMDVEDGNSWYTLGNAYLRSFFAAGTGLLNDGKLQQCLKAFQHAKKDERSMSNHDLYFNSATVNHYLENYEGALNEFSVAASIDPGLSAGKEMEKIVHLLDKIKTLLQIKIGGLASLASSLAAVNVDSSFRRRVTIDCLSEGLNIAVALVGKVLFLIKHKNPKPLYYMMCDENQICYIFTIRSERDVIQEGDQVTLLEPTYHFVDVSWRRKRYQFRSVRVEFMAQVLINGITLSRQYAAPTTSSYFENKI